MATGLITITESPVGQLDEVVLEAARRSLNQKTPQWSGVEKVVNFVRTEVQHFFTEQIKTLPVVGRWASRLGVSITEAIFTVLATMMNFLRVTLGSQRFMAQAHQSAMLAWNANEDNGLLAQTYAYGRKMAGYLLEVLKQCLERSIRAHGMEVEPAEKENISYMLDSLLEKK